MEKTLEDCINEDYREPQDSGNL